VAAQQRHEIKKKKDKPHVEGIKGDFPHLEEKEGEFDENNGVPIIQFEEKEDSDKPDLPPPEEGKDEKKKKKPRFPMKVGMGRVYYKPTTTLSKLWNRIFTFHKATAIMVFIGALLFFEAYIPPWMPSLPSIMWYFSILFISFTFGEWRASKHISQTVVQDHDINGILKTRVFFSHSGKTFSNLGFLLEPLNDLYNHWVSLNTAHVSLPTYIRVARQHDCGPPPLSPKHQMLWRWFREETIPSYYALFFKTDKSTTECDHTLDIISDLGYCAYNTGLFYPEVLHAITKKFVTQTLQKSSHKLMFQFAETEFAKRELDIDILTRTTMMAFTRVEIIDYKFKMQHGDTLSVPLK
jgi:hypothetical protein